MGVVGVVRISRARSTSLVIEATTSSIVIVAVLGVTAPVLAVSEQKADARLKSTFCYDRAFATQEHVAT